MKSSRILLFTLLFLLTAPIVLAQTGGQESPGGTPTAASPQQQNQPVIALHLDTPQTVQLSGTTPVILTYKTVGNETVSITARSLEAEDVLDPTLTVLDPSGNQIASNDDHRTSRTDLAPHDSLIANLTLTDSGRYSVEVAAADPSQAGSVEVLVSTPKAGDDTTNGGNTSGDNSGSQQTNANGQTIDDVVPDHGQYTTTFQANAGDVYTITVRATDNKLDPETSILDSNGTVVASNDDHESNDPALGPSDSQIPDFTIPATDTYTIQITGFAGIGGAFELTIVPGSGTPEATQATLQLPTPGTNNNGQTTENPEDTQVIEGTVKANDVYTSTLSVKAGDVYTITIQATTDSFDPRVSIYLNNDYVIDNDDYGTTDPVLKTTDARIYDWIAGQDGQYEIDVRGYEDSAGDFKMTIEHVASGAPTGVPSEDVQLGSVNSGENYTYTFDAQAGDWVTITARALTSDFDPYVTLTSADGTVLIDNDDNGSDSGDLAYFDAKIPNYHITESGTYTVEVSGYNGSSGQFGLTIGTLR
ncbi:MAG TPA: PPC domain-containing protein [Phototrophicaceae bacterium]|nr:PPC domain-containing protein [Phototrophicaceae bacterium]